MAPPSITMGIGQAAVPGEMGQAAQVVQITPGGAYDAVLVDSTVEITVTAPPAHVGTYVVSLVALAAGPVELVPPVLSATSVEAGSDLVAAPGLWASVPTSPPPVLSYQWLREGTDIPGATGTTYTTGVTDVGMALTVRETATQSGTGASTHLSGSASVTPAPSSGRTIVFSLIGQSNMVGWDTFDGGADYPAGVLQVARAGKTSGGVEGALVPAGHLLDHHDGASGYMGLAVQFAIDHMAANPDDTLVLVPDAQSTTGLATGQWNPGDSYYATAVARLNTLLAQNPDFEMGGFLWHQGESDAGSSNDAAAYAGALDAMIAQIRTDVTGADATTPFVVGGLVPSWVAADANRQTVQTALEGVPGRVAYTAYVNSTGLSPRVDGIHFNAASLRSLGSGYHAALTAAQTNTQDWQIAGAVIQSYPNVPVPNVSGTVVTAGA